MRSFPLTVPAGGQTSFDCAGSRILLCDSASLAGFELQFDNGINVPFKVGRKYTQFGGEFKQVTLHNTDLVNPLSVNLLVGSGDIEDNAVYVDTIQSITQTVNTDDAGTQAAIAAAKAGIETLLSGGLAARYPFSVAGANNAGSNNSTTPVTLLAPASNVNGAIVRSAAALSGSGNEIEIVAKTSAPSGSRDHTAFAIATGISGTGFCVPLPLYLPAGVGIYLVGGTTGSSQYGRVSYDLLP